MFVLVCLQREPFEALRFPRLDSPAVVRPASFELDALVVDAAAHLYAVAGLGLVQRRLDRLQRRRQRAGVLVVGTGVLLIDDQFTGPGNAGQGKNQAACHYSARQANHPEVSWRCSWGCGSQAAFASSVISV